VDLFAIDYHYRLSLPTITPHYHYNPPMSHLFEPLTLRGVTMRNRIGISPMCQYSAEDGMANDWHLVHLGARAIGGAGLIIVEATGVEARGRITPYCLGLWKDEQIEPLARVTRFLRAYGAAPAIQLAHAGRKASTAQPWQGGGPVGPDQGGWTDIVGPGAQAYNAGMPTPRALSTAEVRDIAAAFGAAARRAHEAGFDVVEIHAAHGYLIHSFLSPLSNHRDDEYGGSFDNRCRLLLDAAHAIRANWPDAKPLLVRISATDWVDGGWTIEDSIALAQKLKAAGVDLIDCSSGGNVPKAPVPVGPGYQVPLAERVRRGADIPTATVGMITQAQHADEIVRNGRADMVLIARESLRNPQWPLHAARALGHADAAPGPAQYLRAV
jgi:2,4-dienoyl-CoA reductase-like NADH-dependent reductase (Old Yellow Enzyme family)